MTTKITQFFRQCPSCNKVLYYSNKGNKKLADTKNAVCIACSNKANAMIGEANPFFGKTHSNETKAQIKQKAIERIRTESEITQAKTQLAKVANKRPIKDILIEKYGEQEGNTRWEQKRERNRVASSGSNNPMYGKPSPQGSGNGWSGWYKEFYFRSLRELAFILKYLPNNTLVSADCKKYRVPYLDCLGKERTYAPDFILNDKYIIEIKPKRLWNTPLVLEKRKAIELYCKQNKLLYKIVDPKINFDKIIILYKSKEIKLLSKYEQKIQQFL